MTNVMKKVSAALLSLALVLTMMPILAVDSFAAEGEKAFDYSVNGHVLDSVDTAWLEDHAGDAQIFPYATQKVVSEYVVIGTSYQSIFRELYGISDFGDVNGKFAWYEEGVADPIANYPIPFADAANATSYFTVEDANGDPFSGNMQNYTGSVEIIAKHTDTNVEPGVALYRKEFTSHEAAVAELTTIAADTDAWKAANAVNSKGSPFIPQMGGNRTDATPLVSIVDGQPKVENKTAKNFVGKYGAQGARRLDVEVTLTAAEESLELTAGEDKTVEADLGTDEGLAKVILAKSEWTTDNEAVATAAAGKITAVGAGTCTVKAQLDNEVFATYNVTVKAPEPKPEPKPAIVNGQKAKVGGNTYKVISASAKKVAFVKAANKKSATVPATVKINGVKLNVTSISAKAFKGTKVKTLTVKSKKLTKKSVKGSLKNSKVKTVKVKVGKKKDNKKYVKKYKKYFTKKNAGKKVTVK